MGVWRKNLSKVFGGYRAANVGAPSLPVNDASGNPVEGQAIVLYLNGDKSPARDLGRLPAERKNTTGLQINCAKYV